MVDISKIKSVLESYSFAYNDSDVRLKVNNIIEEKFEQNNNKNVYRKLYSCIDLTTLNTTDTKESIWKFTESVNQFDDSNSHIDNVAAICVYPNFVDTVKEVLTANVSIASVVGSFPSSQTFIEVKIAEIGLALSAGADELDIVMNLGLFFSDSYEELVDELIEIKEFSRDSKLKIIIESGALQNVKNIYKASIIALFCGANFVKTSTGKVYEGATPEAVYTICCAIKDYYNKEGHKIGIKVSGGISSIEDAVKYYTIVSEVLGEEWCKKDLFRIGASRLANNLLKNII